MKTLRVSFLATTAAIALGGGAYAADMAVKAPLAAPLPISSWTGGYIGGSIGTARLNVTGNQTATGSDGMYGACGGIDGASDGLSSCATSASGFTVGVQLGYDWQTRYFVTGVVADWTWTSLDHTVTAPNSSASFVKAKVDWLASFRGRMGLAVDDTMVYVTSGLALADLKSSAGQNGSSCCAYTSALSDVQVGWVAGVGIEHKLSFSKVSIFAEALYYDFGHKTATGVTSSGNVYSTEFTHEIFHSKVGLNYRF
jgi:outer membrane immunogenic protein